MAIDITNLGIELVKKHKTKPASKDPHCDVPNEVIDNLTKCINFLSNVKGEMIDTWNSAQCPKLWKPIHKAGAVSRDKKDKATGAVLQKAALDSEAMGYQWRLSLRNTDVFLSEEHCDNQMYFKGGTIPECVAQMETLLAKLKGSGADFDGVWANVGKFEKTADGKVKVVNGRRIQAKNSAKSPTYITNKNYN